MPSTSKYKLFFIKHHYFFDEGTLFELRDELITEAGLANGADEKFEEPDNNSGYYLPDRGDGAAGFIQKDHVLECPPFAENVPPGKCPVLITFARLLSRTDQLFDENLNAIGIFDVRIEQNLHFQKIFFSLPPDFPEIRTVTLKNVLKDFEVDYYENPPLEKDAEGSAYGLHTGHIAPGFYETEIDLPEEKYIRLRFIKFFPEYFEEKYPVPAAHPLLAAHPPVKKEQPVFIDKVGFPADDDRNNPLKTIEVKYENGFSAELLNTALEIKSEWGENFRKPIDERLLRKFPELNSEEIAQLDKIAGHAESSICDLAERELNGGIAESDIVSLGRRELPWISDANLFRIKNIGMYWARK